MASQGRFKYHPMCAEMKIISLMVADDLIVVCKGDEGSIQCIMKALEKFKETTGLQINPNKSQVVFGGVKPQQQESLLKLTGMGRGKLPFTYLGSPVTTSRLKSSDCDRLVAKLTAKINAWNSKHFSYSAKVRLINAMLMGVITFWTRIFILPKMVLKKIMSICRNFLWGGAADYSKSPLVSWDIICQPKSKGGLGLRNIINWNKATIMKLNWDIANKENVLWVKWIHSRYIQSASYWDYIPKPSSCHYWRQMVRVRDKFREMQLVGEFEVKKGYEWLQGDLQRVGWANWVWNKATPPKVQFIF
ncbi:unnamed protein product [Cuscuta campestris]|uniref:Reverse transcriptase domain-containing protein n=1 Tax=Cuscuta campestris TaxID=132261 RepID=A0A484MIU5_9ASTE|nr:unnamed protein product [Cuscuta campestris]